MSCGVGHRCGLDLALLWLWSRLAATAPIRPLAWEPPYATGAALEKTGKKKRNYCFIYSMFVYIYSPFLTCEFSYTFNVASHTFSGIIFLLSEVHPFQVPFVSIC